MGAFLFFHSSLERRGADSYTVPMFGVSYPKFQWTAVSILALAATAIFLAQSIGSVWLGNNLLADWGSLTMEGLRHGQVWRLISYAFLHDGFWHFFTNLLALLFIGLPLQAEIGQRATAIVIGLMALAGGLAFAMVHMTGSGMMLIGGSAVAVGLLTLFCLNYPDRPITLLLFFVLPVTLLPRWILWFTLAVNLFGFAFSEVAPSGAGIGYSAHLGGMIAAWAVSRWCLRREWPATQQKRTVEPPEWVKKQVVMNAQQPNYQVNLQSRHALQREVDRILDKINTKGFGSLTNSEKETLDKAKDILGK